MEAHLTQISAFTLLIFALGAILLIGGIFGGLTIKEINLPKISGVYRMISAALGVGCIVLSIYFHHSTPKNASSDDPVIVNDDRTQVSVYKVCNIPADDPEQFLNVRSAPGVWSPKIGKLDAGEINVKYLRKNSRFRGSLWYKIETQTAIGWVNRRYLCANAN